MNENKIYLVATGMCLVGKNVRTVQSVVEEMLQEAEEEIIIASYTISGNLRDFFSLLEDAAARGVRILILLNHLESQPSQVREKLRRFSSEFPHVKIYSYSKEKSDLHMKVITVDREKALVGSANITWRGMTENLELGAIIKGKIAEDISRLLENLILSGSFRKISGRVPDTSQN